MDTSLKKFEYLAGLAGRRPEPPFAPDSVMVRIGGMTPDAPADEYPVGFLCKMAAAATAAAAVVAVAAFSAWVDLHNPFLALLKLGGVLERL